MGFLTLYLALFALMFFHEMGHFLCIRSAGIPVETFQVGVGFGPKFKLGDMEVKLGFLPVVGFVLPDIDAFKDASRRVRFLAISCGPAASALLGIILITLAGMPILEALTFAVQLCLAIPFMLLGDSSLLLASESHNMATNVASIANLLNSSPSQSLHLIGVLSIVIAGFNLLPVPPLDGGRLLFEILDALFGKAKVPIYLNGKQLGLVSTLQWLLFGAFALYMLISTAVDVWFSITTLF